MRTIRFSLAFRGYRMSEVDALLDRLAREMENETPDPAPERSPERVDDNAPPD
ncbi:MAG: DivIVA domain-containing protein [Nocardioides sp.]